MGNVGHFQILEVISNFQYLEDAVLCGNRPFHGHFSTQLPANATHDTLGWVELNLGTGITLS